MTIPQRFMLLNSYCKTVQLAGFFGPRRICSFGHYFNICFLVRKIENENRLLRLNACCETVRFGSISVPTRENRFVARISLIFFCVLC